MKWSGVVVACILVLISIVVAEGEVWEEDEKEVLIRSERGAKNSKGSLIPSANSTYWNKHKHRGKGHHLKGNKQEKKEPCRYEKGPWTECDPKTNTRSRLLNLKKRTDGQAQPTCEPTKTIQKKCKKACRYEKGTWSPCNAQNEMIRTDTIKDKSDPSCEQKRLTTKKCKNKGTRANKTNGKVNGKGSRRIKQ